MGGFDLLGDGDGHRRVVLLHRQRVRTALEDAVVLPCATTYLGPYCKRTMEKVSGVDRGEQGNLVAVRRCAKRRQAEQYALVLAAMKVQSVIAPEGGFMTLYVAHEDAARANDELTAYDSENREHPAERERLRPALPRMEVAMAYWAILLFFFAAARHEAFSVDWVGDGAAQAGLMLKGEWWRAVTALCLHVSAAHLLGNLVFGTLSLLLAGPGHRRRYRLAFNGRCRCGRKCSKCACASTDAHVNRCLNSYICRHRHSRCIAAGVAP